MTACPPAVPPQPVPTAPHLRATGSLTALLLGVQPGWAEELAGTQLKKKLGMCKWE